MVKASRDLSNITDMQTAEVTHPSNVGFDVFHYQDCSCFCLQMAAAAAAAASADCLIVLGKR